MLEIITLTVSGISLIFMILVLIKLNTVRNDEPIKNDMQRLVQSFGGMVSKNQREIGELQSERLGDMENELKSVRTTLETRLDKLRDVTEKQMETMRSETGVVLERMRNENIVSLERLRRETNEQLNTIRSTVDEKLQETLESRISKSFKLVNERLEQVYRGLGEMQTLAQGVGDLKRVLSNVKSRGIMGEMQLGAILEQIMSPEQYDENVATVPNSKNVVEFAIKLPDKSGNITYLPIDSKFPGDAYTALLDAYDSGDKTAVDMAAKTLRARLLSEAKDIHEKYISPPYTTDFAIMFLPFEGLYAEAVNRGMVEELQNGFRIMIAGPSTMAAMLNSIQMGFKTLAIEKRSAEVWEVLGAVKTEFTKFETILRATQQRLNQANDELDKLIGVRTRAIVRKLKNVEQLESEQDILELSGIKDEE